MLLCSVKQYDCKSTRSEERNRCFKGHRHDQLPLEIAILLRSLNHGTRSLHSRYFDRNCGRIYYGFVADNVFGRDDVFLYSLGVNGDSFGLFDSMCFCEYDWADIDAPEEKYCVDI